MIAAAPFTFEEQGHIYRVNGVTLPSVTQVLSMIGLDDYAGVPFRNLERARQIGNAVHQACEFIDDESLDSDSVDPLISGYVEAYIRFRMENCFNPEKIEHRAIGESRSLRYGMCVDRIGYFGEELDACIVDLKTAAKPSPAWPIQTAAYAHGLGNFDDYRRMVVHLAKDGSYKIHRYEQRRDLNLWNSALEIAHYRIENGAKIR